MSPYKNRKTPGVYVSELDEFPPSVVGVETAVPAFIGYTQQSELNGKSVHLQPIRIDSPATYEEIFGSGPLVKFSLSPDGSATNFDFEFETADGPVYYRIAVAESSTEYLLYNSIRLFYANGGGDFWVVSAGSYEDELSGAALVDGINAIEDQPGPTMLVVPDAIEIPKEEFAKVITTMLAQCGKMQDRMAILDVWGSNQITSENVGTHLTPLIEDFQGMVGSEYLSYGASYFPFLNTSIVPASEVTFENYDAAQLQGVLSLFSTAKYSDNSEQKEKADALISRIGTVTTPEEKVSLNKELLNAFFPLLEDIYSETAQHLGVLPSSGAMAGVYAMNDQTRGVQNAPANYSLNSIISPTVNLDDKQQGNLNLPLNGRAIDVIREFVGRGTVVWGARTLDGNSNDWRYIQVRRTIIYIEQSIKLALDPFVFAANDGKTWVTVVSMVSNFLQGFWSQGGLMGATASEAFSVECGLGSTMTAQDILEGYMIVQVTLQIIRPAEFIELTFKQKMEG